MDQPSISCFMNTRLLHIYIPICFASLKNSCIFYIQYFCSICTGRIPTETKLEDSGILQNFLLQFLLSTHLFWCFEKNVFLNKLLKFYQTFTLPQNWGCGGEGCYFQPNQRVISKIPLTQDSQTTFKSNLTFTSIS